MKYLLILLFIPSIALAGGNHHHDRQTVNNVYVTETDNNTKEVVISLITAICIAPQTVYNYIWPATVGLFTLSKPKFQSWNGVCWPEDAEAEAKPTPANDVTPNLKNGIRLYQ